MLMRLNKFKQLSMAVLMQRASHRFIFVIIIFLQQILTLGNLKILLAFFLNCFIKANAYLHLRIKKPVSCYANYVKYITVLLNYESLLFSFVPNCFLKKMHLSTLIFISPLQTLLIFKNIFSIPNPKFPFCRTENTYSLLI